MDHLAGSPLFPTPICMFFTPKKKDPPLHFSIKEKNTASPNEVSIFLFL
jgi:hypothetical protein